VLEKTWTSLQATRPAEPGIGIGNRVGASQEFEKTWTSLQATRPAEPGIGIDNRIGAN